jgi:hypothetical protein
MEGGTICHPCLRPLISCDPLGSALAPPGASAPVGGRRNGAAARKTERRSRCTSGAAAGGWFFFEFVGLRFEVAAHFLEEPGDAKVGHRQGQPSTALGFCAQLVGVGV